MVKVFLVSFTDKTTNKVVRHLHVGGEPSFSPKGLQMKTETFYVDNAYIIA